jgi:cell division protein FtsB
MLDKIKNLSKHPFTHQLRDVRVVGLLVFGVIVLLVSWNGVNTIQTNYDLQKQIAQFEKENELHKLENSNLNLRNQYYETDQYLELQARRLFGRAAPGETLVLVPKSVALAHTVDLPEPEEEPASTQQPEKPFYQRNLEAWRDFFFRPGQD